MWNGEDSSSSDDEILMLSAALLCVKGKSPKKKKKRDYWVRPIFTSENRDAFGQLNLLQDMILCDDEEKFFNFTRFSRSEYLDIFEQVKDKIRKQDTNFRRAISPEVKLALTLRYLATGASMTSLHYDFRLGISTVSGILSETLKAVFDSLSPTYLQPPSKSQMEKIADDFLKKYKMPNCVGAIDGKHIRMQCPNKGGSLDFNYKGFHSLVLLAVCDASYKFSFTDVGAYGSESDGGIFARSDLGKAIENGSIQFPANKLLPGSDIAFPHFLIGDEAFSLKPYIMRAYPGKKLNDQQRIFNYRLNSVRRIIENSFGLLSQRFRIFRTEIIAQREKVCQIVQTAICLHNFLIVNRGVTPEGSSSASSDGLGDIRLATSNHSSRPTRNLRDKLADYFMTEAGSVRGQMQRAFQGSF